MFVEPRYYQHIKSEKPAEAGLIFIVVWEGIEPNPNSPMKISFFQVSQAHSEAIVKHGINRECKKGIGFWV